MNKLKINKKDSFFKETILINIKGLNPLEHKIFGNLFQRLLNTLDNLNHAKELKINFNIRGCK
jgi:hypothetical protein